MIRLFIWSSLLLASGCAVAQVEVVSGEEVCRAAYISVFKSVYQFNVDVCGGKSRVGNAVQDVPEELISGLPAYLLKVPK